MKVVIATPLYPPELGVPAAYVRELAERLITDHEVTVVAYATTFEPAAHARLVVTSKRYPLLVRMLVYTAKLLVATRGADVVYAQRALAAGLPAIIVGWLLRVPVIVNFVADEVGDRAQWRSKVQAFVLGQARRVVVPSAYMALRCAELYHFPSSQIVVCPLPLLSDEILPFQLRRLPHRVLAHAPAAPAAIQAMPLVLSAVASAELVVLGEAAAAEQLRALARELGVATSVNFLGRVSSAEEWFSYCQASVYVFDSGAEAGESCARAASRGGAATIDSCGQMTAAKIVELLEDQAARESSAVAGRAAAEEQASWPAHLGTLESTFRL